LYSVGFLANLVPNSIDAEPKGSPWTALAIDAGLLMVFALQHSVMARPWFKRAWTRIVPEPAERSTYVLMSSLALLLLFREWRPIGGTIWNFEGGPGEIVMFTMFGLGLTIVLVSTFLINHFDLFGLRQVWAYARDRRLVDQPFVARALYRIVRHPLMLGFLIAFWATPHMTAGHLLFAAVTTSYILVAVKFLEERDLIAEHGDAYRAYQREVPMIVPRPWRRGGDAAATDVIGQGRPAAR